MWCVCVCRDKNARIGRFSWLVFAALICETLIDVKLGWHIVTIPLHPYTYVVWAIGLGVLALWALWYFTVPLRDMPGIGPYFRTIQDKLKQH